MHYVNQILAVLVTITFTNLASAALIQSNLEDATNDSGAFFGMVTIEDLLADQVRITADISDPINDGITKGDILGLWFDLNDFETLGGFSGAGNVISITASSNAISNSLVGGVNINGSGLGNWDLGIVTGENGNRGGFNQKISIDLAATGLNAMSFANNRVGMRVQSIEGINNFQAGSSKLLGENNLFVEDSATASSIVEVSAPASSMLIALFVGVLGVSSARRLINK